VKGTHLFCSYMCALSEILRVSAGSAISNRRKPKSCLDRIFKSKLGHITSRQGHVIHSASSRVENSAHLFKVCHCLVESSEY
jgi:hypothetical protein